MGYSTMNNPRDDSMKINSDEILSDNKSILSQEDLVANHS